MKEGNKNLGGTLIDSLHQQMEKGAENPKLLLLMIVSVLLSIGSFYTTFTGMLNFMPIWIIAFFITFAVQVLLLATSWEVGSMVVDKKIKNTGLSVFIFVVCLITSVFFSFSSLFDSIFDKGLQERTRITRIHNAVEETISDLEAQNEKSRQELVEKLLKTDAYQNWYQNVLSVADAAGKANDQLRDILKVQARQRAQDLQELQQQASKRESDKQQRSTRIRNNEREIKRLEEERNRLEPQVRKLEQQYSDIEQAVLKKEAEMEAEETGGGQAGERRKGKGKVWRQLEKQRNALQAQQEGINRQLKAKSNELAALDQKRATLQDEIAVYTAELAGIDTEITNKNDEANQTKNENEALGSQENFNASDLVAKLRQYLADFGKTFELQPFENAAKLCDNLLQEMNNIEQLRPSVAGLSCDRGAMSVNLKPINKIVQSLSVLKQDCVAGGDNAKTVTELDFDQAVKHGRYCIGVSALPSNVLKPFRSEIDRLVREESPDSSEFVKTSNAIMAGEKLAWFALIIALVIDFLVLFSGLVGAKMKVSETEEDIEDAIMNVQLEIFPHDNSQTKIQKTLLRYAGSIDSDDEDEQLFGQAINLDNIEDDLLRANVRQILEAKIPQSVKKPEVDKNIYHVKTETLNNFRVKLSQAEKKRQAMLKNQNTTYPQTEEYDRYASYESRKQQDNKVNIGFRRPPKPLSPEMEWNSTPVASNNTSTYTVNDNPVQSTPTVKNKVKSATQNKTTDDEMKRANDLGLGEFEFDINNVEKPQS